jgi:hypothetical protein
MNEVDPSLVALGLPFLQLFVVLAQEAIQVVRPRDVLGFETVTQKVLMLSATALLLT